MKLLKLQLSAACALIEGGASVDCDNPLVAGANDNLMLINYDDLGAIVRDPSNGMLITSFALKTGKRGYIFEGQNNSNEPKSGMIRQRYGVVFDHEVRFKVFSNSPATKDQLVRLTKGRVVAVVINSHTGTDGNAKYEIYGLQSGLIVSENNRETINAETQGAYDLLLKSSDFAKEGFLPATIYDTDESTTDAIYTALLAPAP